MKIFVVGEFRVPFHEAALALAWERDGHAVNRFGVASYFGSRNISHRAQARVAFGPRVALMNNDLLEAAARFKPGAIFVYRGRLISSTTLVKLGRIAPVFGYNNDNPFAEGYPRYFWRSFLKGLPAYTHMFAYRQSNIDEYRLAGAKSVSLLRSFYLADRNFPIEPRPGAESPYHCDIAFVGHYERDGRERLVLDLARGGLKVGLFGPEWQRAPEPDYREILTRIGRPRFLADDYNYAINSATVALVLFSKLNKDTYTRRCFEIPATKTAMLCQYSDDVSRLFQPEAEAVFFSTPGECARKAAEMVASRSRCHSIGLAGYQRLRRDGHEAQDRAREILDVVSAHVE